MEMEEEGLSALARLGSASRSGDHVRHRASRHFLITSCRVAAHRGGGRDPPPYDVPPDVADKCEST